MQAKVVNIGADALSRPGAEANHTKASSVDLICQLIYRDIRWSAHEHLSELLLGQVVDQCRGCHSLSSAWWALNKRQRCHERFLNCVNLEMIQFGLALHGELLRNVVLEELLRGVVTKNLKEDVLADGVFVLQEYFKRKFHPIKRCRFPDKLDCKFSLRVLWRCL